MNYKRKAIKVIMALCLTFLFLYNHAAGQQRGDSDPLHRIVERFRLEDESILEGLARLSADNDRLGFSIEHPLPLKLSDSAPAPRRFTTDYKEKTIEEIINEFVILDPTYTWSRDGNMINVYPSSQSQNPKYLMNRVIPSLNLTSERAAADAMFHAVAQLPPPKEQIANLQIGNLGFAKSWTVNFQQLSLRSALNRIALNLGPTFGWQLSGAEEFRIISFHERLAVTTKENKN